MPEWNDEQIEAWNTVTGSRPIPGSSEPVEGKCGARLRNRGTRDTETFLGQEWGTLPDRYCTRPAGSATEHVGFGPCGEYHLGKTKNIMSRYMPVAMEADLKTLAEMYDEDIGLDPAAVEAERIMVKNKRMFLALEKMVMELQSLVSTDAKGTEKIAPVMELWLAVNEQLSKWAQFALKYEISERRIALEESQAQAIANVILSVVMDATLQLEDWQLDQIRENLGKEMERLSPSLRPDWANDFIDVDEVE